MSSVNQASAAADVFQAHRDELGFVNKAQCAEKDLYTVERDGRIVGAALGNHCVRKPQTTLYELAVLPEYRREGIATELIDQMAADSPHDQLVAKCPVDLPANEFYDSTGWSLVDREEGKNRALNVWGLEIDEGIDIITTGNPPRTELAERYGYLRGTRLDNVGCYDNAGVSVDFLDVHWEDPDYPALFEAAERHRPKYVVAGDYDGENYDVIHERADELRAYAENVIVVPHEPGEVDCVPDWCVVGYSTPTEYGGTDAPVWEYYGRDVHILGGTPHEQLELLGYLTDEIVSMDCNSHYAGATRFAKYWTRTSPRWHRLHDHHQGDKVDDAYEASLMNITYALREKGVLD